MRYKFLLHIIFFTSVLSFNCKAKSDRQKPNDCHFSDAGNAYSETALSRVEGDECVIRGGLPNLFGKLDVGQDITVAYFGGSITAQSGYRIQTFQWFEDTWPGVKFTQVDAAIGGTGSLLGAFRLYNDVLVHKPDLIFIEFAVNDFKTAKMSYDGVVGSVEGIVRQVIRANPKTDICFVYTITEAMLDDIKAGKEINSIIAHEAVAKRYGLPSINMGTAVAKMEAAGKLVMKGAAGKVEAVSGESLNVKADLPVNEKGQVVFSNDGVHPYTNSGHKIYTEAVVRALPRLKGKATSHRLGKPIRADNLEKAKMVSLNDVELSGDWQEYDWDSSLLPIGIKKRMSDVRGAKASGNSISFKFKGTVAGYYDIMGPAAGVIEMEIDGKKSYSERFDKYCTYHRIANNTMNVANGVHSVKFTLTDRDIDKETLLKQNGNVMDDPARFADKRWYVGNVMLIGYIIAK